MHIKFPMHNQHKAQEQKPINKEPPSPNAQKTRSQISKKLGNKSQLTKSKPAMISNIKNIINPQ